MSVHPLTSHGPVCWAFTVGVPDKPTVHAPLCLGADAGRTLDRHAPFAALLSIDGRRIHNVNGARLRTLALTLTLALPLRLDPDRGERGEDGHQHEKA